MNKSICRDCSIMLNARLCEKSFRSPSTRCYVDVKSLHRDALSSCFLLSRPRETCCYTWHGTRPSHWLKMRPLRHKAPGSLSQGSNRQEFCSPGSPSRRVVPWGDVSSWVKGAEWTCSLTMYGRWFFNTSIRRILKNSLRAGRPFRKGYSSSRSK